VASGYPRGSPEGSKSPKRNPSFRALPIKGGAHFFERKKHPTMGSWESPHQGGVAGGGLGRCIHTLARRAFHNNLLRSFGYFTCVLPSSSRAFDLYKPSASSIYVTIKRAGLSWIFRKPSRSTKRARPPGLTFKAAFGFWVYKLQHTRFQDDSVQSIISRKLTQQSRRSMFSFFKTFGSRSTPIPLPSL